MTPGAGDIFEVELGDGFGYFAVLALHPLYPEALRVLKGRFTDRPDDLAAAFVTQPCVDLLCPCAALGPSRRLGRITVSPHYPKFRIPIRDRDGAPLYWWIWDGNSITPAPDEYPIADLPTREILGAKDIHAFWRTTSHPQDT